MLQEICKYGRCNKRAQATAKPRRKYWKSCILCPAYQIIYFVPSIADLLYSAIQLYNGILHTIVEPGQRDSYAK